MFSAIFAVVALIAVVVLANRRVNPPPQPTQNFDENAIPFASEGETILILFGTREIKKSNVVGAGGYHSDQVEV